MVTTSTIYDQLDTGDQGSDITGSKNQVAMLWNGTGSAGSVRYVKLELKRQNSATGTAYCGIWSTTGVLLKSSPAQDVSEWNDTFELHSFDFGSCFAFDSTPVYIGIHYDETSSDPHLIGTMGNRTASPPTTDITGLYKWNGTIWVAYDTANRGYMNGIFDYDPGAECGSDPAGSGTLLPPPVAWVRL